MWKIIFDECRPIGGQREIHRDPNAIAAQRTARFFFFFFFFFPNTYQKMRGGKHVKVKKRQRQDICVFALTREN